MSKLTKSYKNKFTTVPNSIINDKTISLKAKGVYLFLISKPDDWRFSVDRIASQNSDGLASVKSALKELEEKRFLKRVQVNNRGTFGENDYIIFDEPFPIAENRPTVPSDENPPAEKLSAENRPTLVNTDLVNREEREIIVSPLSVYDNYPDCLAFVNECLRTTRRVHSPQSYKSSLLDALGNPNHKNHAKTLLAYHDYVQRFNNYDPSTLPEGVNYFDYLDALSQNGIIGG